MQSFLWSRNYYSRFIEDFVIYASVLYEFREADFYEIHRLNGPDGPKSDMETDRGPGSKADSEVRTRWERPRLRLPC